MYTQWTQHLKTPEEKSSFERQVWSSKDVLDFLVKVIDEKEKELRLSQESLSAYDKPNWDFRTAHQNGYLACLRNLRTLVNLDQQKEPQTNESSRPTAREPSRA
jgi:hypothetical protein